MKRRDFVAASIGASMVPALGEGALPQARPAEAAPPKGRPQVFELRRYQLHFGPMQPRYLEYAKGALVPALNRAGIKPVGAFTVSVGADGPAVYLLLPHPSAESVITLPGRIAGDAEYMKVAAPFRSLPATDPPYVRRASSLMIGFDNFPTLEAPAGPTAAASRVFELRTYESHNENANLKKIEMFEKAGEIEIFRRVGITPVFFARNIVGPNLPSLTYMTVFADMAARDKGWTAFGEDPAWVKLRTAPGYTNPDILTNTTVMLLRPTDFSQV
jgi:hypothetical protein